MTDSVNVPREPTREMTLAGAGCLPSVDGVFGLAGALSANVYRAMLSAAPKAEPAPASDELLEALKALEAVATEAHNLPLNWPIDPEARLLWEALNRATFFADEAIAKHKGPQS